MLAGREDAVGLLALSHEFRGVPVILVERVDSKVSPVLKFTLGDVLINAKPKAPLTHT